MKKIQTKPPCKKFYYTMNLSWIYWVCALIFALAWAANPSLCPWYIALAPLLIPAALALVAFILAVIVILVILMILVILTFWE